MEANEIKRRHEAQAQPLLRCNTNRSHRKAKHLTPNQPFFRVSRDVLNANRIDDALCLDP